MAREAKRYNDKAISIYFYYPKNKERSSKKKLELGKLFIKATALADGHFASHYEGFEFV